MGRGRVQSDRANRHDVPALAKHVDLRCPLRRARLQRRLQFSGSVAPSPDGASSELLASAPPEHYRRPLRTSRRARRNRDSRRRHVRGQRTAPRRGRCARVVPACPSARRRRDQRTSRETKAHGQAPGRSRSRRGGADLREFRPVSARSSQRRLEHAIVGSRSSRRRPSSTGSGTRRPFLGPAANGPDRDASGSADVSVLIPAR